MTRRARIWWTASLAALSAVGVFGCLFGFMALFEVVYRPSPFGQARAQEISKVIDPAGLRSWAATISANAVRSTNFQSGAALRVPPLELALPKSVREIPTFGLVGPTAIEVVNARVELLYINSWGDAFRISISPSGIEDPGDTRGYRIAAGVYYRDVGTRQR
jgi:hypothetical protein